MIVATIAETGVTTAGMTVATDAMTAVTIVATGGTTVAIGAEFQPLAITMHKRPDGHAPPGRFLLQSGVA